MIFPVGVRDGPYNGDGDDDDDNDADRSISRTAPVPTQRPVVIDVVALNLFDVNDDGESSTDVLGDLSDID